MSLEILSCGISILLKKGKNMNTKLLLLSAMMMLSTTFATANANLEIEVVSGATLVSEEDGDAPAQYQMCLYDDYVHMTANGYNGGDVTWTVSNDIYAYNPDFYFVPPGVGVYTVRLFDGTVINGSVDNKGAELDDTIIIDAIECYQ